MINKLIEGNNRFVNNQYFVEKRQEYVDGQNPSVIIICCSDSRLTTDYIFDLDIGDVFEIVNAGNVIDDLAIENIQFALDNFDITDIICCCHEKCGAISSGYRTKIYGDKFSYPLLYDLIESSIVTPWHNDENNIIASIKQNAINSRDKIMAHTKPRGIVNLYCCYYNLRSGKVDFFI